MWRRLPWLVPLFVAAACTGLYLDHGNAYPCDYAKGPGLRDEACIPGDVCGANNLCQMYLYEGPRFEGGQVTVPEYGAGSGEGTLIHPLVLKDTLTLVSRDLPYNGPRSLSYARSDKGELFALSSRGNLASATPQIGTLPNGSTPGAVQPFISSVSPLTALLRGNDGSTWVSTLPSIRANDLVREGAALSDPPLNPKEVRFIDVQPSARVITSAPVVWDDTHFGVLVPSPGVLPWHLDPVSGIDPRALLDLAGFSLPGRTWVFTLTRDQFSLLEVVSQAVTDGGLGTERIALDAGVTALATLDATNGMLRTDRDGRVVAAARRQPKGDVLSTFQVTVGTNGPTLTQPWPDCTPCQTAGQHIGVMSASVATGVPAVEVVCTGAGPAKWLRVIGSVALEQADACRTESFELPVAPGRLGVNGPNAVPWVHQTGLLFGGPRGELWSGETISGLHPAFLDRVPLDVAPALVGDGGAPTLAALSDDSLSVLQTDATLQAVFDGGLERLNGFRRIDPRELGISDDTKLLGLVHGTPGWAVTSGGDVARTTVTASGLVITTAAKLVTASGGPIHASMGGEAFIADDAGLQAVFALADDSLYFVKEPRALVAQGQADSLPPDLTPEPSVPIRSLALERTPLGTDGISRARGYVVTSRNVYGWELAGGRWSSTPLALAGGEPLEAWFDSSHSAQGRVGYRDGEILTLPGGFQLTESLPMLDGGVPPQVLDYENLGGWPVAYATTGLYIAGWEFVGGALQNRFPDGGINRPMTWREVSLPDGQQPWMKQRQSRPAKLFVQVDPRVDGGTQTHRLLLFLDDEVLQVAHHVRH